MAEPETGPGVDVASLVVRAAMGLEAIHQLNVPSNESGILDEGSSGDATHVETDLRETGS
jgi:hypothetical protein